MEYAKPLLIISGDTHKFNASKPFKKDGITLENVQLLQVFGSKEGPGPNKRWLRVNVDTNTKEVFSVDIMEIL